MLTHHILHQKCLQGFKQHHRKFIFSITNPISYDESAENTASQTYGTVFILVEKGWGKEDNKSYAHGSLSLRARHNNSLFFHWFFTPNLRY